jgi:SnoaL-like domain
MEDGMNGQTDVQRLADDLAIRSVLAEYCLRLELNPFEEWMQLFTPDTVYEVYRRTLRGRDEVAAMLSQAPHGLHLGGPLRIELDGDSAKTVQNYLFINFETKQWNMGWYYRTLIRTSDGWRISHTVVKMQK